MMRIKKMATMASLVMVGVLGTVGLYEVATPDAKVVAEASGTVLRAGMFVEPDAAHPAGGGYSVVATEGGGRAVQLDAGFNIVHAPDPHLRVNGQIIAKVVNYEGAQAYPIPNFIGDVESVDVWCKIAGVYLAVEM